MLLYHFKKLQFYCSSRFGPGGGFEVCQMKGTHTYRGFRTDLVQILRNWPFQNSNTVFLNYKVKSKI